jgi:HAD superfamily hydrolase (TIGR01509 family)
MMRKIDLVIFDCDGVLLDSELISCDCAVNALQSAGMNIDIDTVLARFVGTSRRDMGRQVQAEGYAVNPDFAEKLERSIADAFEHRLRSMPGIEQALSQLTLQRCVASSSPVSYVRRGLELTKLSQFFGPHLFSASMVARGKPSPDIFLYAAEQMKVAPEHCLVIEDSLAGVKAANAAQMPVFWFLGGSHIDLEKRPLDLNSVRPDQIFESMWKLPELIGSFCQVEP